MARVPTYNGPQLRTEALRAPQQQGASSAAAFGEVMGRQQQALAGAAQDASNQVDRVFERKATDDAFRAETAAKAEWLLFEQELRKRRGKDAEGIAQEADRWWQDAKERYGQQLDPRAQQLISRSLGQARLSGMAGVMRYQEQELERSFIESTTAGIGVEIQRYVTEGDPNGVAAAKGVIRRNLSILGARQGWTAEVMEQEMLKYTSQLHARMLDVLVDDDPEGAKAYFEANRSEIDSANQTRIDRIVTAASNEREAEGRAASLATLPYDEQLAKAGEITDRDLREATIKRVRENQQEIEAARAARERQVSDQVWQLVANGTPLSRLPRSLLDQMDGKERVSLNQHYEAERNRRLQEAEGRAVKTDLATLEQLYEMPNDEFLKVRISTLADKLSRGDMEELIKRQARIRNGDGTRIATFDQQVTNAMDMLGLAAGDNEKKGQFRLAARDMALQFYEENKREPNERETQAMLDQLSMKGEGWFAKRYYQVYGTPDAATHSAARGTTPVATPAPAGRPTNQPATVRGGAPIAISQPERRQIMEALRSEGVPVTEESIQARYRLAKGL